MIASNPNPGQVRPETRVTELKLELPPAPKAMGVYKPVVIAGNMAYVSGHGPLKTDGSLITGRVGADLDLAAGKASRPANRPGHPGDLAFWPGQPGSSYSSH